jgi:DNA-binding MarR family transcriptional regulator
MLKSDQKIGALSTFLQQLDKLGTEGKRLRYFRGHSKESFQLKPSIYRNSGWITNEATMLKELLLRCPNDFAGAPTTFQCLVKMQHYGLPTRLLDVTSNPLVALYFACETHEEEDEDGEVIIFDYDVGDVKYFDSDTVSVISNLSRRPSDFAVPDLPEVANATPDDLVKGFNEQEAIKLLLHDIGSDKPHFLPKVLRKDLLSVVCVKPLLDNPRIIRQEGAFLLYGCNKIKVEPAPLHDQVVSARFTINRDEKRNLLNQLRTLGISRATMFPEIEQVATHVKQAHWTPRIDLSKLTPTQAKVFGVLRTGPARTVLDVVSILRISSRITSKTISELQKKGAVELVGSGRERRWKLVEKLEIANGLQNKSGDAGPGEADA